MITLEDHNKKKQDQYDVIETLKRHGIGISCPKCKGELYETHPGEVLFSMPPKKHVHCGSCNFTGHALT